MFFPQNGSIQVNPAAQAVKLDLGMLKFGSLVTHSNIVSTKSLIQILVKN